MNANEVIRPNSECTYWDVPGTDQMVHSYRTYSGSWIIEVIEPSAVMGPHGTITFLSGCGIKPECYGTRSTWRIPGTDNDWRELYSECYRMITDVYPWEQLLDLGVVRCVMGRIEVTTDN